MSLPEELEELELPPPQLEVPPALFEVGRQSQQSMQMNSLWRDCTMMHTRPLF